MTYAAPSYLDVGRDGEAISDARLSFGHAWPDRDPRLLPQRMRPVGPEDEQIIAECVKVRRLDWQRFLKLGAGKPLHERVFDLLNHRSIQFNSRSRYRESPVWSGRIRDACDNGRPVSIVLPVFCVIRNPVKRFEVTVPTTAEEVTLRHLAGIAEMVRHLHPAGAVFHLVTDSTFYSLPFGVTAVEAIRYVDLLRKLVADLGFGEAIQIHDMSQVLSARFEAFQDRFEYWCTRFHSDPLTDGITQNSYDQWLASMAASINTSKLRLDYCAIREQFGEPLGVAPMDQLYRRARTALAEYRALKAAAADLQWEEAFFPNSIRATIHTKAIPSLGLRLYPEYKFRSSLLPYHGIGVIRFCEKTRLHYMTVEPEMFLCGRSDLTRITGRGGRCLHYLQGRSG